MVLRPSPIRTARFTDGVVPVIVPAHRTYRAVRVNRITWTWFDVVTVSNPAPSMAFQTVPSSDSSIQLFSVAPVPVSCPTCWTAKHGPSPETRSIAEPLRLAVWAAGAKPEATTAADARSSMWVDTEGSLWMKAEGRVLANPERERRGLNPLPAGERVAAQRPGEGTSYRDSLRRPPPPPPPPPRRGGEGKPTPPPPRPPPPRAPPTH